MNEAIITRWNEVIKNSDTVYHLGDVMLGADLQSGLQLISKLKGDKYLAYGNHDSDIRLKAFEINHLFKNIQMGYRLTANKKILILTHYPTIVSNYEEKIPVYSIHGHTHSFDICSEIYHAYNVNMDAHNCCPINLEELIADIRRLKCIEKMNKSD